MVRRVRTTKLETRPRTPARPIPLARRFCVAWSTSSILTVRFGSLAFFCRSRMMVRYEEEASMEEREGVREHSWWTVPRREVMPASDCEWRRGGGGELNARRRFRCPSSPLSLTSSSFSPKTNMFLVAVFWSVNLYSLGTLLARTAGPLPLTSILEEDARAEEEEGGVKGSSRMTAILGSPLTSFLARAGERWSR